MAVRSVSPGLFILRPPASQTLARKHGRTAVAPNIVHGDPTAVQYSSSPSLQAMDRKPKAVRKKSPPQNPGAVCL